MKFEIEKKSLFPMWFLSKSVHGCYLIMCHILYNCDLFKCDVFRFRIQWYFVCGYSFPLTFCWLIFSLQTQDVIYMYIYLTEITPQRFSPLLNACILHLFWLWRYACSMYMIFICFLTIKRSLHRFTSVTSLPPPPAFPTSCFFFCSLVHWFLKCTVWPSSLAMQAMLWQAMAAFAVNS